MSKLKIVFYQTLMISTAILFGIGIQTLVLHLTSDYETMSWQWYIPLSIVLAGFLCSVPTILLLSMDNLSPVAMKIHIGIHFILVGGIVSGCGMLFGWFATWKEYAPILVMYVIIYFLTWFTTLWIARSDDKKINEAIKDFWDEE